MKLIPHLTLILQNEKKKLKEIPMKSNQSKSVLDLTNMRSGNSERTRTSDVGEKPKPYLRYVSTPVDFGTFMAGIHEKFIFKSSHRASR